MKRFTPIFILLFFQLILTATADCYKSQEKWQDISYGIDEMDLRTVSVDPNDQDIIYAGSAKSIFQSLDGGKQWQKLYIIRGTSTAVNVICIDPKNEGAVYAGTQNGLFKTADGGISWNKIFDGLGAQEKEIRHMFIDLSNAKIYIGTNSGLFSSGDEGKTWDKSTGEISNRAVTFIAQNTLEPSIMYITTPIGVFKSKNGGISWERIFTAKAQASETETDETSEDTNTDETTTFSNKTPNCIAIDSQDFNKIYVGTNSGVFVSYDAGKGWEKLTTTGLLNNKVAYLLFSQDGSLYASTKNGIFKISHPYQRWEEIYTGLLSKDAQYLAYNQQNNFLLAATKNGLYKTYLANNPSNSNPNPRNDIEIKDAQIKRLLTKFEYEPTIQDVQRAAVRYAEVHKEKIDEWRRAAKKKAILPTLSVGMDRYLTDYYHWDSGTNPDTIQKGKAPTDWSVTVSWDLGDLIWSTDQTSIDVRSRLMVQLRDDLLDEITRLYFERRRLQIELLANPPKEVNTKLERILRLQELTAGIDALTGGYLSQRIKEVKAQNCY